MEASKLLPRPMLGWLVVRLVAATMVNWPNLLSGLNEVKHRNPITSVDIASRGQDFNDLMRFMLLDTAMSSPKVAEKGDIAGDSMCHSSLSFLLTVDKLSFEHHLIHQSRMPFTGTASNDESKWIYLISGSLRNWVEITIRGSTKFSSTPTREIFNNLLLQLELAGLGPLFKYYRRVVQSDSTFILEDMRAD